MKTYICDSCQRVIHEPYEMKMKEFCLAKAWTLGVLIPEPAKRRITVHLCDDCFRGLSSITQKKAEVEG